MKAPIKELLKNQFLPGEARDLLESAFKDENVEDEVTPISQVIKIVTAKLSELVTRYQNDDDQLEETKEKELTGDITNLFSVIKSLTELKELSPVCQVKLKPVLTKIVLSKDFKTKVKHQASHLCERIIEANGFKDSEDQGSSLLVYFSLLEYVLTENVSKQDLKRVWAMHGILSRYDLSDPQCKLLVDKVMATVVCPKFLDFKEGRQHIGFFLSLEEELVPKIQALIKKSLPSIKATSAAHYGEVYFQAWTYADASTKTLIEETCIQSWIQLFLELHRNGREMTPVAKVIFKILSSLHSSRRLLQFSSAITRLYTPFIWRSLKSDHPLMRCNAAQLFLDVFPLEKPEATIVQNSLFKEKQLKEITDLLLDECPWVRIVAVKGVSNLLSSSAGSCLSDEQCRQLIRLLTDLATETVAIVRQEVYLGLAVMIGTERGAGLLVTVLPQMSNHLHDINESCRKAFVKLLLAVNDSQHTSLKYTNVCSFEHCVARLTLENKTVGEFLTRLLIKKVYSKDMEAKEVVKRLIKLIYMSPIAAEKLLQFSYVVLSPEEAHIIILSILSYLRMGVQKNIQSENKDENIENQNKNVPSPTASPAKKKPKKRGSKKKSLQVESASDEGGSEDKHIGVYSLDQQTEFLHTQLLLCTQVTWLAFNNHFNQPACKPLLENLYTITCGSIQLFLRYYKGTHALFAAIALVTLVPISKLMFNTTVTSTCISELKNTSKDTDEKITSTLVFALCSWNRGHDVIELAMDWIDPAFKLFHLNSSSIVKPGKRKACVKFHKSPGKHMLGVKLLSILFSDQLNESRLLEKEYNGVHDLFTYLYQGVKVIMEKRMSDGLSGETSAVLSDDFLVECFKVVLNLAHSLHQTEATVQPTEQSAAQSPELSAAQSPELSATQSPELMGPPKQPAFARPSLVTDPNASTTSISELNLRPQFNSLEVIIQLIEWTSKVFLDKLPDAVPLEEFKDSLALRILSEVQKVLIVVIKLNLLTKPLAYSICTLNNRLLNSRWKNMFFLDGLETGIQICHYGSVFTPKDEWGLFTVISTHLHRSCLSFFEQETLSQETFSSFSLNAKTIKSKLMSIPLILSKRFGCSHKIFKNVFDTMFEICLTTIWNQMIRLEVFEKHRDFSEYPFCVEFLTKCILSNSSMKSEVFRSLRDYLKANRQEGLVFLSGLCYLYTLLHVHKQTLPAATIETTIQDAYVYACAYKRSQEEDDSSDSFIQTINVSEQSVALLMELGKLVGCTVRAPDHSERLSALTVSADA